VHDILLYDFIRDQYELWLLKRLVLSCRLCSELNGCVVVNHSATPSGSFACLPSMITLCGEF